MPMAVQPNVLFKGLAVHWCSDHYLGSKLVIIFFYLIGRIQSDRRKMRKSKVMDYKFSQVFGYKGPEDPSTEEDNISGLRFDPSGSLLAVSDKAGRIIVFEAKPQKKGAPIFDYFTEFQSHVKEFDPLRSMEIEEEIVAMRWMPSQGRYHKLISSNARTIKVWKIFERTEKVVAKRTVKDLTIPKLQTVDTSYVAEMQRALPNKHISPINSVSLTLNEEYVLSSDEGQVLLWSLQHPDRPYLLVNHTPKTDSEEQKEMITCSEMHPTSDSLFAYGMDKGSLRVGDLRVSSESQSNCLNFGENKVHKNYVYELLAGYSSLAFARSGKNIITRDFLTVKVWDVCNPKKPVKTVSLNDGLKAHLCDMVENQSIFDKFPVRVSRQGTALTGSYSNYFHLIDTEDNCNAQYELNFKNATQKKEMQAGASMGRVDYGARVMAIDFNPRLNLLAAASKHCFFTYAMP